MEWHHIFAKKDKVPLILLGDIVVVLVVHTPRGNDDHVISMRNANKHEQQNYWKRYPF